MGKSCQEREGIKTGLESNGEKLSEVSPSLDRFGVKRGKAVRSKSTFGQVRDQTEKSCQK